MLIRTLQKLRKMEVPSRLIEKQGRSLVTLRPEAKNVLSIMSYNILAPSAIEAYQYPKHQPKDLDTKFRLPLVAEEIRELDPDIVCLQEVDSDCLGYFDGLIAEKKYSRTFKQKDGMGKRDAAMTLLKAERFDTIATFHMDFLFQNGKNYDAADQLAKEMYYPAVALFVIARDRQLDGRVSLVANTHLVYNNKKGHVKLGMLVLIFRAIEMLKRDFPVQDVYFSGDFNMISNSMLYAFMTSGELDLDVDLQAYSNQAWAIDMNAKRELGEALAIQDYKFGRKSSPAHFKIDPRFVSLLAGCQVAYGDGPQLVFRQTPGPKIGLEEAQAMFRALSDDLYLSSVYSVVGRALAAQNGKENPARNYEKGVTFFVNTMANTVDYIWSQSSLLTPNQVLQKPPLALLEALPHTAPVKYYPSDHFCLYATFCLKPP